MNRHNLAHNTRKAELNWVLFFYHGATALVGQGLLIVEDS